MAERQETARRRERMVMMAAALEFDERGYAGTTYGSIAARSGLPKTRVQYWAPSKSGLAQRIVEEAFAGGAFVVSTRTGAERGVDAVLDSVVHVARTLRRDPAARAAMRLLVERRQIEASLPTPFVGWMTVIAGHLTEAVDDGELRAGFDPNIEAWILVAAFVGVKDVTETLAQGDVFPERATVVVARLLGALGMDDVEGHTARALSANAEGHST